MSGNVKPFIQHHILGDQNRQYSQYGNMLMSSVCLVVGKEFAALNSGVCNENCPNGGCKTSGKIT